MTARILVADDDPDALALVTMFLSTIGHDVTGFPTDDALLEAFERTPAELVILDVPMPGSDGFKICRRLRAISPVPVMMLTARDTDSVMIGSVMLGADDYLTKPVRSALLQTRVHALLRHSHMESTRPGVVFGDLSIDQAAFQVTREGRDLALTSTEFEVLSLLIGADGDVMLRQTFMRDVRGQDFDVSGRALDETIRRIRKKLVGADSRVVIENKWGRGYRLRVEEST